MKNRDEYFWYEKINRTVDEYKQAEYIISAQNDGFDVWELDTGTFGEDEILVGDYDDCLDCVLQHHDLEALPDSWSMEKLHVQIDCLGVYIGINPLQCSRACLIDTHDKVTSNLSLKN